MKPRPVSVSIVIEWENFALADRPRSFEMLQRLATQLVELEREVAIDAEVLFAFDPDDFPHDEIRGPIAHFSEITPRNVDVRTVKLHGGSYFTLKNAGAMASRGGILIFLDSDVLPEDRWLSSILHAFDHREVDVVAGASYVAPDSLYSAAVSLFWFFPVRDPSNGLVEATQVFANNVAFRRQLFLSNLFPERDRFRGQCGLLIEKLKAEGRGIYLQRSARCSHPAPNGFEHFVRRAACEGYDNYIGASETAGGNREPPYRISYWTLRSRLPAAFRKIAADRRRAGASAVQAGFAMLLATLYCGCIVLGELLTRMSPAYVRRHLSI
jgi:hypothetical protein